MEMIVNGSHLSGEEGIADRQSSFLQNCPARRTRRSLGQFGVQRTRFGSVAAVFFDVGVAFTTWIANFSHAATMLG
jgi:hypothetical protein